VNFDDWRELASEYVDGTLPPAKRGEVQAFLALSPEARADEAALRGLNRELRGLPEVDPPLFFADNVLSRIQREQAAAHQRSWRAWLPSFGRLAAGSLVTGGALAALAWVLFFPNEQKSVGAGAVVVSSASPTTSTGPLPKLMVGKPALRTGETPALEFSLTLEHAERGSVLARVPGGKPSGLFFGRENEAVQTLRVPVDASVGVATVELTWTGNGTQGEKWLLEPLAPSGTTTTARSFGQPELPLVKAVAEVVRSYGQAVTLEDLPNPDLKVRLDARNETLEALLKRHLEPLNLSVTVVGDRLTISPKR